jgi:hypothetical protein
MSRTILALAGLVVLAAVSAQAAPLPMSGSRMRIRPHPSGMLQRSVGTDTVRFWQRVKSYERL